MTIREAQDRVDQWIKTYGVRYFNELTNMACLTEEVGELARVIARKYGEQSFKEGEKHGQPLAAHAALHAGHLQEGVSHGWPVFHGPVRDKSLFRPLQVSRQGDHGEGLSEPHRGLD